MPESFSIILHLIENPKEVRNFIARPVVEKVDRIIGRTPSATRSRFYSQGEGEGERLRKLADRYVLTCGRRVCASLI